MEKFIRYTGSDLDRVSKERKNPKWILNQLQRPDSFFVLVWQNLNLISNVDNINLVNNGLYKSPHATLINRKHFENFINHTNEIILLGMQNNAPIFAADVSGFLEADIYKIARNSRFLDLRQAGMHLSINESALMAFARGLCYWHRENHFCNRCGSKSLSQEGGHLRLCQNKNCTHQSFPRTDPAVIMLVQKENQKNNSRDCLLGRQKAWPEGMYSTLAGFVEPGESLEEAVSREVFEESGIQVKNIRYQYSQPWPFPSSIMLGFLATAVSEKIIIDKDELEDIKWFSEKEIREFGEWGDKTAKKQLPRKDSIARHLIDAWVNHQMQ